MIEHQNGERCGCIEDHPGPCHQTRQQYRVGEVELVKMKQCGNQGQGGAQQHAEDDRPGVRPDAFAGCHPRNDQRGKISAAQARGSEGRLDCPCKERIRMKRK